MGPNSLVQAALPAILDTPAEWFGEVTAKIQVRLSLPNKEGSQADETQRNAEIMYGAISVIPGLSCSIPAGSLYMLVHIDPVSLPHLADDVVFSTALYREEAVFVLPGMCFEATGYFRIVIASPEDVMRDVAERLEEFCARHRVIQG